MKIHVLSDLHLEHQPFHPKRPEADVVVMAGDIAKGTGADNMIARWYSDRPVIYIAGNHEFYHASLSQITARLRKTYRSPHVHFLEKDALIIDGVRFLGTTLWTNFALFEGETAEALAKANASISDFRDCIRLDDPKGTYFRAEDSLALHHQARTWLEAQLAEPFDGTTVVVTHHAPSLQSVSPRYRENNLVTAAYASNLEELAQHADLWIHGHTHHAVDYQIGRCRVVSNPHGYYGEGTGFEHDFVIEVGHE